MPRYSKSRSPSPAGSRSRSRSPAKRESQRESRRDRDSSPPASFRDRYEKEGNKDSRGHWKKNETASKCVGVFGLDWNTSERELERKMKKYGQIVKCVMVMNRVENRSKGFGFVTYERIDEAEEAVKEMNGRTIEGRTVRVDYSFTKDDVDADRKRERGDGGDRDGGRRERDSGRDGGRAREPRRESRREKSPEYARRPKRSSRSPSPYRR